MKKTTLIRNESPHAVNMPEGSVVAARKTKKAPGTPVPQETAPTRAAGKAIAQTPAADIAPAVSIPPSIAAKPRAKARLKTSAKVSSPSTARSRPSAPAPLAAVPLAPGPVDEAAIWEADNPVKSRMAQLKARNALLEEQLQRLQPHFQARGRKP